MKHGSRMSSPVSGVPYNRRGATLVESTIVLGTFLMMMLAMLDLSLVALRQNSLDAAARQVGRTAMVRGELSARRQTAWGPAAYSARAAQATEMASAARERLITMDPQQVFLNVDWPDGSNQLGARVRVRLAYRHQAMFPMLYGSHLDLRSQCITRIAH